MNTLLTLNDEKMEASLKNNEVLIHTLVELSINEKKKIKCQKKDRKKNKINNENNLKNKEAKKEKNKFSNKKQIKISNDDISIVNDKKEITVHEQIICDVCEMSPIKGDR